MSASAFDGRFDGADGASIGYRIYDNDDARGAIVLVNGYSETYLMYDQLARELVRDGFRVYALDHRGQGVSDRLIPRPDVGHVDAFANYVADLATFVEQIVRPVEPLPLDFLGHSTGGLIAVHYAAAHPGVAKKMVLSAPFFELNSRWTPLWLARALVSLSCAIGRCEEFAPTQGSFDPEAFAFEDNRLTHSEENFEAMRAYVWRNPALFIRGASNGFLKETMAAGDLVPELAPKITSPVLLFQAGVDHYVRPGRQDVFCALTKCEKVTLPHAYHELLFEAEPLRTQVYERLMKFLKD